MSFLISKQNLSIIITVSVVASLLATEWNPAFSARISVQPFLSPQSVRRSMSGRDMKSSFAFLLRRELDHAAGKLNSAEIKELRAIFKFSGKDAGHDTAQILRWSILLSHVEGSSQRKDMLDAIRAFRKIEIEMEMNAALARHFNAKSQTLEANRFTHKNEIRVQERGRLEADAFARLHEVTAMEADMLPEFRHKFAVKPYRTMRDQIETELYPIRNAENESHVRAVVEKRLALQAELLIIPDDVYAAKILKLKVDLEAKMPWITKLKDDNVRAQALQKMGYAVDSNPVTKKQALVIEGRIKADLAAVWRPYRLPSSKKVFNDLAQRTLGTKPSKAK